MASIEHIVSRNLQCPVCLGLLSNPKQLSCTHTFCKKCLNDILTCSSHKTANCLACPICRKTTDVMNGNIENLNTNVPLLLKSFSQQLCDTCDSKSKATHFCSECGKKMCKTCLENHNKWLPHLKHRVVSVEDFREGKVVVLEKEVFCPEHPSERQKRVCTDVCITCKKFICMRCWLIKHKDHTVQSAEEYNDSTKTEIESLKARGKTKATIIKNHQTCIERQKKRVTDHIDGKKAEINTIYDVSIKKLNESKAALNKTLETQKMISCQRLDEMKAADERLVMNIESASVLASNSLKAPLDGDTIVIRDSLSGELKNVLGRDDPEKKLATDVADRAEQLIFTPNNQQDQLFIGEVRLQKYVFVAMLFWISIMSIAALFLSALPCLLVYNYPGPASKWILIIVMAIFTSRIYPYLMTGHGIKKCDVQLSKNGDMNGMAPTPDDRMAVGYSNGGIDFFSAEGKLQQTVLKDEGIRRVGFLSNGQFVVLGFTITLYTQEWEKLDASFETLSEDEGGLRSLSVDSKDLIYVSYRKAKKIQVFSPTGGKAIREIPCNGYEPVQITSYNDLLLITDGSTIRMIDKEGNEKFTVETSGVNPFVAVTQNNSILIAWVQHNDGLVSIDEYTNELKHVKTLISDQKIENSEKRNWYYLHEFRSGKIAFCTPGRLYIFSN